MLTREEVQLRVGVDARTVGAQMSAVERTVTGQIDRTVAKSLKSLRKLMTFNVTGMAIGMVSQIIPTAQEFWDRVYGVDAEGTRRYEEANERLRKLRENIDSAVAARKKLSRDAAFEDADAKGKVDMLAAEGGELVKRNNELADSYAKNAEAIKKYKQVLQEKAPTAEIVGGIGDFIAGKGGRGVLWPTETQDSKMRREQYRQRREAAQNAIRELTEKNAKINESFIENESAMIAKGRELRKAQAKVDENLPEKSYSWGYENMNIYKDPRAAASAAARAAMMGSFVPVGGIKKSTGQEVAEALQSKPVSVIIKGVEGE